MTGDNGDPVNFLDLVRHIRESAIVVWNKDLYQVQETLKKLCGFSTVWADRADLGSTKTAKQKLKYATFEASFFMFSWAKNDLNFFLK